MRIFHVRTKCQNISIISTILLHQNMKSNISSIVLDDNSKNPLPTPLIVCYADSFFNLFISVCLQQISVWTNRWLFFTNSSITAIKISHFPTRSSATASQFLAIELTGSNNQRINMDGIHDRHDLMKILKSIATVWFMKLITTHVAILIAFILLDRKYFFPFLDIYAIIYLKMCF